MREMETVFYLMGGSEVSFQSFQRNAAQISIVGPQVYRLTSDGRVEGGVEERVRRVAQEHGVAILPLIHNPGFDQESFHHFLMLEQSHRDRVVRALVAEATENAFLGWQFDFENIRESDRDRYMDFYEQTSRAMREVGKVISIAVVPQNFSNLSRDANSYYRYMEQNWRGCFDYERISKASDFVSLMTYSQHTGNTPPGPIASVRWMKSMIEAAVAHGIPPEQLSVGIPTYSNHWYPIGGDTLDSIRSSGGEIHFDDAIQIIDRAKAEVQWLPEHGVSVAILENLLTGVWEYIYLESAQSFQAKMSMLLEDPQLKRLRGISVWALGTEDPQVWPTLASSVTPARSSS